MSLLYKSLEQLRRKEGAAKAGGGDSLFSFMSRPKGKGKTLFGVKLPDLSSLFHKSPGKAGAKGPAKPGQGGSKLRRILLYGVLLLMVLGVSTAGGLYFFSDLLTEEVQVQPRPARRTVTARPAPVPRPAAPAVAATENETTEEESATPPPAPPALEATPVIPSQSAPPAAARQTPAADHPPEPAPAPASRTGQGKDPLESHFSRLAKRNQEIMYLENSLATAMRTGDTAGARDYLDSLMDTAGENSPAVLKWEGFLALKENRPAEAEDWFRKALGRAPNDVESKYNLIVALMLQNKQSEAQAGFREMAGQHPSDPRIQRLGAMMGL